MNEYFLKNEKQLGIKEKFINFFSLGSTFACTMVFIISMISTGYLNIFSLIL